MRFLSLLAAVGVWLMTSGSTFAVVLYNLDFQPPEIGSYTTVFGTPTIVPSVGPLSQALVFDAVTGYEQIRLPINLTSPRYDVQCDVFLHNLINSSYAFSLILDTPEVRTISFHGGINRVNVFQPFGSVSGDAGPISNDVLYHLGVSVDLPANTWSVAVNGVPKYSSPFNAAQLSALRFNMSPARGGIGDAPGVYAALDNLVVTATPEPSPGLLAALGVLLWVGLGSRSRARCL